MPTLKFATTCNLAGDLGAPAQIEALGYDGIWAGDHVMNGRPMVDCLTGLAAVAALTRRVDLITSVLLLPLRHPVPVAKALTTIDHLSKGRLIVGVGVGGEYPEEWQASGVPLNERGPRCNEGLELLRRVWTEDGVTHTARFYPVRDVTLVPRPYQRPHPPIWVGGRREASQRRAARFASGWVPYLITPEHYREGLGNIQRYAQEYGRALDMASFTKAILLFVAMTDVGGYDPDKDPTRPDRKRGDRYYIIGDTAYCVHRFLEYAKAGVEYFTMAWVSEPGQGPAQVRHFAEKVIPALRAASGT